ncbi:MAG TPA: 50S ribosomal protein L23 [Phycisphaerae bacterium]|nr:50S ribosomal protein L23 [Phycisphaerae bacterium]HUU22479.1 50S ribosomal protein L23 [Phycisphaerae bacterium]
MKNDIYNVIVRPMVTEKGTFQAQAMNAYAFRVNPDANKTQVRQAIEKIYGVKVLEVRTANRQGKPRRVGYKRGVTRHWKKAVVVLHPDQHIDLF